MDSKLYLINKYSKTKTMAP